MAREKDTYALVTANGWPHAIHNHLDIAERDCARRSCQPEEEDAQTGKHVYHVVRYTPDTGAAALLRQMWAQRGNSVLDWREMVAEWVAEHGEEPTP